MLEFKALRASTLTAEVVRRLEEFLHDLPSVEQFTITLETQELHIVFDEVQLDFYTLTQAMAKAGCPLRSIDVPLLKQVPLRVEANETPENSSSPPNGSS